MGTARRGNCGCNEAGSNIISIPRVIVPSTRVIFKLYFASEMELARNERLLSLQRMQTRDSILRFAIN